MQTCLNAHYSTIRFWTIFVPQLHISCNTITQFMWDQNSGATWDTAQTNKTILHQADTAQTNKTQKTTRVQIKETT